MPFGTAEEDSVEDIGDDVAFDISLIDIEIGITLFGRMHVQEQMHVSLFTASEIERDI